MNYSPTVSIKAAMIREKSISSLDVHIHLSAQIPVDRVTIGVFGHDGKTKNVKTLEAAAVRQDTVRLPMSSQLSASDHVLVMCNAPADFYEGCITDEQAFRNRQMTIDEALSNCMSPSLGSDARLPMFGESQTLTPANSAGLLYTAEVSVSPLLAKITVDHFEIDLQSFNGERGRDLFIPESLLLTNVPEALSPGEVCADCCHGDMSHYGMPGFRGHSCLCTNGITAVSGHHFLKNLPLFSPSFDSDSNHPLMLVVKGQFAPYGVGQMLMPTCFPLPLGSIKAGMHYHISATVGGIGSSPVYDAQGNPIYTPLDEINNKITVEACPFDDMFSPNTPSQQYIHNN